MRDGVEEFWQSPWRTLTWEALGDTRMVPTMLSPEERRAYVWLTENWYAGTGAIVELGCFAGGSTAALAEGLRRADKQARIQAFDRFTVAQQQKVRYLYSAGVMPFDGTDLLPIAERFLKPWKPYIDLHRAELDQPVWPGDPIELLVMDASKSVESMDQMAKAFFPSLIPQRSLIVQQDFLHWKQPWIAAQMARLLGAVTPVAFCAPATVIFRVQRRISELEIIAAACNGLSDDELRQDVDRARELVTPFGIGNQVMALDEAIRLNPGIRRAGQMVKAPR